jgi:hypothetical protein
MRSILTLIALTCMPAFGQDAGQKLTNIGPLSLRVSVRPPTPRLCSIPLLNATAPGKPVPMPALKPRNPRTMQHPPDYVSVVPPAPACPGARATTKP